ncbi:MAG: NHL repeat-containing protein [Armatimonadetes bacterium]|nr:NHL repeat-containing protein [Armatimonadota bacterium]
MKGSTTARISALTATLFAAIAGVNAQPKYLLVCSMDTDSILRFDAATGSFVDAFVPSGSGGLSSPHGFVFGPDGNLYVASRITQSIMRYDGETGDFIDEFASGGPLNLPNGIAFGPDGNLYVASSRSDSVLRYDGQTGAFIDEFVPPGSGGLSVPVPLYFGSDGHLYVGGGVLSGSIKRYNGTTGAYMGDFTVGAVVPSPTDFVWAADGNLYVSAWDADSIMRFNGVTGEFVDIFVTSGSGGLDGPRGLRFGPDGNLYVCEWPRSGRVLRFDGFTGEFIDNFIEGGGGLSWPAYLMFSNEPATAWPEVFRIFRGLLLSGGLPDLFVSDESRLVVQTDVFAPSNEPPVQIEVEGTSQTENPSELRFRFEGMASRAFIERRILLYNYVTQSYEELHTGFAATSDEMIEIVVTANASRFVEPGTGQVKSLLTWKAAAFSFFTGWNVGIDQTIWRITP